MRGYESFTRECFEALRDSDSFELFLLKGGGVDADHEFVIKNLPRKSKIAKMVSRLFKTEPYLIEQLTFCIGMLPKLFFIKPAVIYYSDFTLGAYLWNIKKILNLKVKLLFSNGAPNGPPYSRMDHIQQLLPVYFKEASENGVADSKQTLIPYAIRIDREYAAKAITEKSAVRTRLDLPKDRKIIVSVGAINSHHKRMDYVVSEFSTLPAEGFYLLIIGQFAEHSAEIISLAERILNNGSYRFIQLEPDAVRDYLIASDYFILASLHEGLPRVLPEALAAGLLPIVHNYVVTQQTLGDHGIFCDLTKRGALVSAINKVDTQNVSRVKLIDLAFEKYSWQNLASAYLRMIYSTLSK